MRNVNINGLTRITKPEAKKQYLNGVTIYMIPCKIYPLSPWWYPHAINRKNRECFVLDEIGMANDFDNAVGSYEYYNCNFETGKYASFYIKN